MSWVDFAFNMLLISGGAGWLGYILGYERGIDFGRKAESSERDLDEQNRRDIIKRIRQDDDHV